MDDQRSSSGVLSRVIRSVQRIRGGLARRARRLAYALFGAGSVIGGLLHLAGPEGVDPELVDTLRGTLGNALGVSATALLVLGVFILPIVRASSKDARVVLPGPLAAREPGAVAEFTLRGEVHRIPVADFESGHVVPAHRMILAKEEPVDVPAKVVLMRRGGDVWNLEIADVDEGLELLAAVGLGPKARALRLDRRRPWSFLLAFLLNFLALPLVAGVVAPATTVLPPFALGFLFVVLWVGTGRAILDRLQPSTLAIGADGIAWREGREPRFVAHRDIRDARFGPGAGSGGLQLVLTTAAGEVPINLGPIEPAKVHAALAHVLVARGEARAAANALARGGRDFAAWEQSLRDAMVSDYRKPGVPKVRVVEILEDPHAPADQRLGAAIALATSDPDRARTLALDAARAAADPALAEALEAFADARLDAPRAEAVAGD